MGTMKGHFMLVINSETHMTYKFCILNNLSNCMSFSRKIVLLWSQCKTIGPNMIHHLIIRCIVFHILSLASLLLLFIPHVVNY